MNLRRRSFLCSSAAFAGVGILGSADAYVGRIHPHHSHAASLMTECANRFLNALDANQRGKATFPFETDERMNWHYIPKERKGLPLRDMTPYQKHLASALLAAGLSQTGYIKAVTIMSLEDVLKLIENDSGERRNPEKYYFSVFGTPSDSGTWGYRVEGHHLSQNYMVVNGTVVAWSGGINRGDPHYYRVQTPHFLIELDDTQDNANHIHAVWRDFAGDFGEDLLQQHYQASHQKK